MDVCPLKSHVLILLKNVPCCLEPALEEMSGMDVLERIRGTRIPLAILAIEADVPEADIAAALKGSGALTFLQECRIARHLDRSDLTGRWRRRN
ncbi:hypothetical protein C8N38_105171 [Rhodovulum kholense]|uniref:Uncharacterized protein n=2 Tax=Rhodovulum TaxID=34008 RepID=A0A8E2VMI5_9RHOB|nr:hypothetical protein C8N38_105171 [Rhodovulum kholense]